MKFIKFFKPILIRLKPLHLMKLAGRRMFALPLGAAAIQLTGTKLHDNLKDPLTQFKTLKEAVKYFKLPGIGIISDLSVEPEACGCPIKFRDNEFPLIFPRYEELNDNDIESLPIPQPQKSARMPVILEVVRHLSRSLGVIIGAGGIGPLTLAGEILGTENVFKMTLEGKEKLHKVIGIVQKWLKFIIRH